MQELVTTQIKKYGDVTTFTFEHKIAYFLESFLSHFYETTNSLEEDVSPKDDTNLRMSSPLISA